MTTTPVAQDGFERASREIAYAYERVAFFRKLMDQAHVKPDDIRRPEEMGLVPPTRKAHYRANFPAGVIAKGYSAAGPLVRKMRSAGTEGERLVSVAHVYDLAQRMATCLRANARLDHLSTARTIRTCRYAAPNCSDVECSNPNSSMQDRMLPDNVLVLPVYHDVLATPASMLDAAAEEIVTFAPNLLYVDPTHMARLVRHMRSTGRPFPELGPVAVALSFSLVTRVARDQIEELVGPDVPVVDTLAMSEFGFVGLECEHGRMHLNTSDFYVEILDGAGQPAGDEIGRAHV